MLRQNILLKAEIERKPDCLATEAMGEALPARRLLATAILVLTTYARGVSLSASAKRREKARVPIPQAAAREAVSIGSS